MILEADKGKENRFAHAGGHEKTENGVPDKNGNIGTECGTLGSTVENGYRGFDILNREKKEEAYPRKVHTGKRYAVKS